MMYIDDFNKFGLILLFFQFIFLIIYIVTSDIMYFLIVMSLMVIIWTSGAIGCKIRNSKLNDLKQGK